jgi:hypothetical protein
LASALASYYNQMIYTFRVSAFSFYLKKKTHAKEKQTVPTKRQASIA